MAQRSARVHRFAALALSAGLITGLGACSPVHTLDIFDPSDGVRAVLDGEVNATNLLVLTTEEGAPGTLVGSLSSVAESGVEVSVTVGQAPAFTVDLEPGQTAYLTPRDPSFDGGSFAVDAEVPAVSAAPGGAIEVSLTTASGGATDVQVPVLDGTIEPYAEFLP